MTFWIQNLRDYLTKIEYIEVLSIHVNQRNEQTSLE